MAFREAQDFRGDRGDLLENIQQSFIFVLTFFFA